MSEYVSLLADLKTGKNCSIEAAIAIEQLQQQLAAITAERDALKEQIEEAEKQDGVSWLSILNGVYDCKLTLKRYSLGCAFAETIQSIEQKKAHGQLGNPKFGHYPDLPKLYAKPIPSPDTAELIRKAREEEIVNCAAIAMDMFHKAAQGDEIADAIRARKDQ